MSPYQGSALMTTADVLSCQIPANGAYLWAQWDNTGMNPPIGGMTYNAYFKANGFQRERPLCPGKYLNRRTYGALRPPLSGGTGNSPVLNRPPQG